MLGSVSGQVRQWLASGANRIVISIALRGTFAAAVPFLLLRASGHPVGALFATVAALNLTIADSGGPYRQRLVVMALVAVIVPVLTFAGMHVRDIAWLAVVLMFFVALLGGMARLFGGPGTALGLIGTLLFVIGMEVPADFLHSLEYVGWYFVGAVWTILLALVVWRLRPYRRLRYEIGDCFRGAASLFGVLDACCGSDPAQLEERLARQRRSVRATLEQTNQSLGETLLASESVPSFVADLIVLLRAVTRIDAAAVSLGGVLGSSQLAELSAPARKNLQSVFGAIEESCRGIAAALLGDRSGARLANPARHLEELWASIPAPAEARQLEETLSFFNVIMRHLQFSRNALARVVGTASEHRGWLPPLHGPAFPNFSVGLLRANLTLDSLILRHALRVAFATAGGTALFLFARVPHGIWIPLTTLIILQPHLGATLTRAFERTAGTLLGAAVAGGLLLLLHDTPGIDAAILVCFFFTLIFFRRRYWVAVMFLTPLIILLLSLLTHAPWLEITERIADTLIGALIALVAGYLLWPSWEARRLPEQLADAVQADHDYLMALLGSLATGNEPEHPLPVLRGRAELAAANTEAALERMLSEPRRVRAQVSRTVALVTHLQRLTRHLTRLAIYLESKPVAAPAFARLGTALDVEMKQILQAARSGAAVPDSDELEQAYQTAHGELEQLRPRMPHVDWGTVEALLSQIIGDVHSLQAACA